MNALVGWTPLDLALLVGLAGLGFLAGFEAEQVRACCRRLAILRRYEAFFRYWHAHFAGEDKPPAAERKRAA
jgi:hypothetical protein